MYSAAPLSEDAVREILQLYWGINAATISYEPIGYGSFHWSVSTPTGARWLATADTHDSPFAVDAAYSLARRLADNGLEFVRAPVLGADGSVTRTIDRWLVSLWPWLDGRSSTDHRHRDGDDLAATMAMLRELHAYRGVDPDPELIEKWAIAGREEFWSKVTAGGDGPYEPEVSARVQSNQSRIVSWFSRYDELVKAVDNEGTEFVITHGEPHAGNVVHTEAGAKLIDWDTVRWAPKERDLWSLTDYGGWWQAYGSDAICAEALEAYQLQWTLSELVAFVATLLAAERIDADTEVAIGAIRAYLPT